ncbi:MAG: hypothetical protein VXX02_03595 [Pseudomonadota bacterium]|nr:hypothetical protein [Pseudomonadota bacterium]
MTYSYTIKTEDGINRICTTDPQDGYVEIQAGSATSDAEYQSILKEWFEDTRTEIIWEQNIEPDFTKTFKDDIYLAGEIKRTDWSCDQSQAQSLVTSITAAFPEYSSEDLLDNPQHCVGSNDAYRPPYADGTISYYFFNKPDADVLASYGASDTYHAEDILNWHGIKFDTTAKTKMAKFVFNQKNQTYLSNLPNIFDRLGTESFRKNVMFFARLHSADGSVSKYVDTYVLATNSYMKNWCAEMGKPFPLPDSMTEQPWCFGIVHDDTTGAIECVKAYVRTQL